MPRRCFGRRGVHESRRLVAFRFSLALLFAAATPALAQVEVPRHPEQGGPLLFEVTAGSLNLREEASTSSAIVARLDRGTVLNNLGCQQRGGQVWCDVQPLGGGPRGFVAASFLRPAVSPHGAVAYGPDDTAFRAGQGDFDANGPVSCARDQAGPMGTCEMGVARRPGGFATVVVTHPDGRNRVIFFQNGVAIGADTSEADYSGPFEARKDAQDTYQITVGRERYAIPEMVVFGG